MSIAIESGVYIAYGSSFTVTLTSTAYIGVGGNNSILIYFSSIQCYKCNVKYKKHKFIHSSYVILTLTFLFSETIPPVIKEGADKAKVIVPPEAANSRVGFKSRIVNVDEGIHSVSVISHQFY